jgi:hypothetical protein
MNNSNLFLRLIYDIFDAYEDDFEGFKIEFENVIRKFDLNDKKGIQGIFVRNRST